MSRAIPFRSVNISLMSESASSCLAFSTYGKQPYDFKYKSWMSTIARLDHEQ
jgi:hypothetical protein